MHKFKNNINLNLFIFFSSCILVVAVFLLGNYAIAQSPDLGMNYARDLDLQQEDPRIAIVKLVRLAITFVGIIAVVYLLYAGFLWMTATGNEEKVSRAKRTLINAVIGLVVILSAFLIVSFVINRMGGSLGGGGLGPGSGPGRAGVGLGALGACTVESVYPEPGQREVPRNTAIIVTFKEEINNNTICSNSTCNGENIIPGHIRVYQSNLKDSCIWNGSEYENCEDSNITEVSAYTTDNMTYMFVPDNYLGSLSDYIKYTVYLSNDILKTDGSGVFTTCSNDYLRWEFEVSNMLDLTPPQVQSVFPGPDNEGDDRVEGTAGQAEGSITVNAEPQTYIAASFGNAEPQFTSENATITGNYNCQEDGTIEVSVNTSNASVGGVPGVVSGDDITDEIASIGCGLTLTPADGTFYAGDSWTIDVVSEKSANTLTVGSNVYRFVSGVPTGNEIQANGTNGTAANIASALSTHPDINALAAGNVVTITARVAGSAGNNINLSSTADITISPMAGGTNAEVTVTVNDREDKPRNAVVQVNFNEAINPITVSGNADDLAGYIRIIYMGGMPSDYLAGHWEISNQYRTVEFISDNLCGVNGCGENIYCLPGNSNLEVDLIAANLVECANDGDCTSAEFNTCGGNNVCQNISGENYPLADILAMDGIMDAALNSFDGDRQEGAEGPGTYYNENTGSGDGDDYQWSFFISNILAIEPPIILGLNPEHSESNISQTDPIELTFNKLMMSSSLKTGQKAVTSGNNTVIHKLLNIWSFSNVPTGYWIAKNNIDSSVPPDGEGDRTVVYIRHTRFYEATGYRSQAGSGLRDIYQNCFKPVEGPDCIDETTATMPSCCPSGDDLVPATVGSGENCD